MATLRSTESYTPTPDAVDFASRALQSFADVVKNPPETITFGVIDPPYKQTERQRQERILDELAKEAQDLDLGYYSNPK